MKTLLGIITLVFIVTSNENIAYKNCMERTKLDYISERGAKHVAAQCKAFILEELMSNN